MHLTTENEITVFEIISAVRKRPTMYIGTKNVTGFCNMLGYFLDDVLGDIDQVGTIRFELSEHDRVRIEIRGNSRLNRSELLTHPKNTHSRLGTGILIALCERIKIEVFNDDEVTVLQARKGEYVYTTVANSSKTECIVVDFNIDREIFESFELNYRHINTLLIQYARLNPGLKIISVSHGAPYQKNVFAFINGVSEQLDEVIAELPFAQPRFRFDFKATINNYSYQISLCYEEIFFTKNYIRSYANSQETYLGGSLVEGILEGMIAALKRFALARNIAVRINKKTIVENLILIAAVKGPEIEFSGSTRWTLAVPKIKKDCKAFIDDKITAFLQFNKQAADSIIARFMVEENYE